MKIRSIPIEEAAGLALAHDLTQIDTQNNTKGARFRRGQIITEEDLPVLRRMGRRNLDILELEEDEIHEDDAAIRLAEAFLGEGIEMDGPEEGRCRLVATTLGIVRFDPEMVKQINSDRTWSLAVCPENSVVAPGEVVAAFRILPLALKVEDMEKALKKAKPFSIVSFRNLKVGLVTTGSEIKEGLVKDVFREKLQKKLEELGGTFVGQKICGDEKDEIAEAIKDFLQAGTDMVICTGGMSVDLEDRTPAAIGEVADEVLFRGVPMIPGSNLMLARKGRSWLIGAPACVVHSERTSLDRLLLVLFADLEDELDVAGWGVDGLCSNCRACIFPKCHFARFQASEDYSKRRSVQGRV